MKKDILSIRENGSKLKMFWRSKLFDILPDSAFESVGGKVFGGRVKTRE